MAGTQEGLDDLIKSTLKITELRTLKITELFNILLDLKIH